MSIEYDERNKTYRFKFYKTIGGKICRASKLLPAGYSKSQAQTYDVKETARLYDEFKNPGEVRVLISEAVYAYVTHHCPELKDGYGIAKELERLEPFWKGRTMDELAAIGLEYRKAEGARLKPATIRNKLSYLRAACRYAQEELEIGDPSLKLQISMPKVDNERHIYIERSDILKICKKCHNRTARAVLRIAFYSGMRISETIKAGENVASMKKAGFLLPDTKNGTRRIAALHPRLRVLIKYFPLPYKKRYIQRLIRVAMNEAGYAHVRLHDVRHSTASALINKGVDLYTVGKVLGQKSLISTARYAHLNIKAQNDAVNKIK
jgi:integrase